MNTWPNQGLFVGTRLGRLTVTEVLRGPRGGLHCVCLCDCGTSLNRPGYQLLAGIVMSCGCARVDMLLARNERMKTHGMRYTPTYQSWIAMKARCLRPTTVGYEHYGGRGIGICAQWMDFKNFLADMGECPAGKTLDRKNVDGDYEPGNCRWATSIEQARNKRCNVVLTLGGEAAVLREWAERIGMNHRTLEARIRRGWSHEYALTAPLGSHRG